MTYDALSFALLRMRRTPHPVGRLRRTAVVAAFISAALAAFVLFAAADRLALVVVAVALAATARLRFAVRVAAAAAATTSTAATSTNADSEETDWVRGSDGYWWYHDKAANEWWYKDSEGNIVRHD